MKNRILLFQPKLDEISIPWALLYISARLEKDGFQVKIIDQNLCKNWQKEVVDYLSCYKHEILLAGATVMTGPPIAYALEFSRLVKEKANVPVVWGGIHPTLLPEQTLSHRDVDMVVIGEGDDVFLKLVNSIRDNRRPDNIQGVGFKINSKLQINATGDFIDLDKLAPVPYHLIDIEGYISAFSRHHPGRRRFELPTSRGCPYKCGFCYNVQYNRRRWRKRSANNVIKDIIYLKEHYRIDFFHFRDDEFFIDKKRVEDICRSIIDNKINLQWSTDCRIDHFFAFLDDFIELIKSSGCGGLVFGVESGSQRILNLIEKNITLEQVYATVKKLQRFGIHGSFHFMIGFPGETLKEMSDTLSLLFNLQKINPLFNFLGPSIFTPYPGIPLLDECMYRGFNMPDKLEKWVGMSWKKFNLSLTFKKRMFIQNMFNVYLTPALRSSILLRFRIFNLNTAVMFIEYLFSPLIYFAKNFIKSAIKNKIVSRFK